jgi:hypothetical protein
MTRLIVPAALAGLAALVQPAAAQSVGGRYWVQGTGFDGQAYGGEAQITLTSDVTCEIVWNTGGQIARGICMRQGNVFSAAYSIEGRVGMAIYQIAADGSMTGQWTIAGVDAVGTESLYRK